jgi:hypothetical protein
MNPCKLASSLHFPSVWFTVLVPSHIFLSNLKICNFILKTDHNFKLWKVFKTCRSKKQHFKISWGQCNYALWNQLAKWIWHCCWMKTGDANVCHLTLKGWFTHDVWTWWWIPVQHWSGTCQLLHERSNAMSNLKPYREQQSSVPKRTVMVNNVKIYWADRR